MEKDWWKQAVVYQIYPRSFLDTNADGIGDIQGIIQKLSYLKKLGVDVLWLSPVYRSPNDDNGYDISDYEDIMEDFGTMQDMDELLAQTKKLDIKIVMDLVVNHTSDEHYWFQEACKSKENPYRDFYIWRDPVNGREPNDLASNFGGSAWEYDKQSGQYYLHLFSKKQPDLNWSNPKLREAIYKMMNVWIAKGVSGFRMDVIDLIGKIPDEKIKENGPMLHPYLKEMNRKTFGSHNMLSVGETWKATIENALLYSNPDGSELSMIFQFEHMKLDKVAGTPYIYQGEEIGMTNIKLERIEDYKDIETLHMYKERIAQGYRHEDIMDAIYYMGRDNARTPMQWNANKHAGFTQGTPWLQVNKNYPSIHVEQALKDKDSIFYTYQKLIAMRKQYPILTHGSYTLLDTNENVYAYQRDMENEHMLIVCNFSAFDVPFYNAQIEKATILLSNYKIQTSLIEKRLRPYEANIYHWIET